MSEACRAAAEYWFDVLGFDVLRESKAMINEPSRRVSEREGMRLVGVEDRNFVSGVLPAGIWEISADEWRARQTGLNQLPAGCAGLCESVG
jgi:RimJ/RimL family protein N-acetyltransferase